MPPHDRRISRRTYLVLTGGGMSAFAGCQTRPDGSSSADEPVTDTDSSAGPTDAPTEATDRPTATEATETETTPTEATPTEASAGAFPVPPDATESDLQFSMDLSKMRPSGGRNDRLTDLLFFVDAPDGLDPQGFEVDSASQVISWYDGNAGDWTLDAEEQVQITGSFAKDEMSPGRGGGMRGQPNLVRRYRAGDRGAFVWVRGSRRMGGQATNSLVLATGPWEQVDAISVDYPKRPFDRENLPKFLTHNVCDFKYVDQVSKFRSAYGHSHTADFESCRTNKHYIEGSGVDNIPRYAPVSGTIHQIMQDGEIDLQTFLVPDEYPEFVVRQEHILLDDHIEVGTHVGAGERLGVWNEAEGAGTSAHATAGEIIIHMRTPQGTALVSFFNVLSDEAFQEWVDAGGPDSRSDYVIPKEVRDANPNTCTNEFYDERVTVDGGNWVTIE